MTRALALLALLTVAAHARERRSRVFNAPVDAVWTAAVQTGKEGFLVDRVTREEGRLRLRSGPLRAYRFEVYITPAGNRTRVELELYTSARGVSAVTRDAWRNGDRFLILLAARLGHK